jgi:hypothetical protein
MKGLDKEIIPPEAISQSEYFSEVYFVGGNAKLCAMWAKIFDIFLKNT